MPCPGSGSPGEELTRRTWRNWAGTRTRNLLVARPSTLQEVVAVVINAENAVQRVKAAGSSMSYSDAAVANDADVLVETDLLQRELAGESRTTPDSVVPFALTVEAAARADRLVHVESGIKLHTLNCLLDGRGLAMPTLGGAFTQSIVGAISTGTHGSDIDRPPIVDAVRAIHLVGPGGKEWWIEREGSGAITDPRLMEDLRAAGGLCADAAVLYDDRTFRAVLVSLGRMGIIYSVVLEAVPAFRLRETREPSPWSRVVAVLRSTGPEVPVLRLARVDGRIDAARSVDIALSPYRNASGDYDAIVARRWETDEEPTQTPATESFFTLICRQREIGSILAPLIPVVHGVMMGAFGFLLKIPLVGPVLFGFATGTYAALMSAMTAIVAGTTGGANLGEALARVASLAASVNQSWIVRDLVNVLIQQMREPFPLGFAVDEGFRMMTGQQGCPDQRLEPACMRQIDAVEYAFNASAGQFEYLGFVDDVCGLATRSIDEHQPVGAGLSIRFMRRSEALLAMQQYEMTCTVEIFSLRGLPGNDDFLRRVAALADARGGRPHWGLMHDLTESQVQRLYGENHVTWRRVLSRLIEDGGGRAQTFSSAFSVRRGLEPLPGCTLPLPLAGLFARSVRALARAAAAARARG